MHLLVYGKSVDFCIFSLLSCTIVTIAYKSQEVFSADSFRFSTQMIMSYVNEDGFISSFPAYVSFICLIYSISKDFQCSVVKEWWGTNPCLVLSGKALSFSPLNMTLAVAFFWYIVYVRLRKFLSIPSLLRGFPINVYWFSSKDFSTSIDIIMLMIFFFF